MSEMPQLDYYTKGLRKLRSGRQRSRLPILFQEGLAASTAKGYLSVIRYTQIALGLGDPKMSEMPQLDYYTKGLRKLRSGRHWSRLPITPEILLKLHTSWESFPNHFDAIMLWAASCVCFFAFLRSGEIAVPSDNGYDAAVQLSSGDVRLDNISNPLLHVSAWALFDTIGRFTVDQGGCITVLGLQFPNWSGYYCGKTGVPGFPHQDTRPVGKCSIYPLHPHTP